MDKAILTENDITALLQWRDEHKELVRDMPPVKKAIEISFAHNPYKIKGIRNGKQLKIYFNDGQPKGHAEIELLLGKAIIKKWRMNLSPEDFQSVLTVYSSLLALMAASPVIYNEQTPKISRSNSTKQARPKKAHKTYIIRRINNGIIATTQNSRTSPKGVFNVRGHYRHLANGRIIWIKEYQKGTGKTKAKTYALNIDAEQPKI